MRNHGEAQMVLVWRGAAEQVGWAPPAGYYVQVHRDLGTVVLGRGRAEEQGARSRGCPSFRCYSWPFSFSAEG